MSIIYSYPEQGVLNADDMLIGTSAQKVGGKQKNLTKNFTIQQVADFINGGLGDDIIYVSSGSNVIKSESQTIIGGHGSDTLSFETILFITMSIMLPFTNS